LSADSRGTFFEAIRSEKQDMIRYPVIRGKMRCRITPEPEFTAVVKRFFFSFLVISANASYYLFVHLHRCALRPYI
jgi:hypothetical protein